MFLLCFTFYSFIAFGKCLRDNMSVTSTTDQAEAVHQCLSVKTQTYISINSQKAYIVCVPVAVIVCSY